MGDELDVVVVGAVAIAVLEEVFVKIASVKEVHIVVKEEQVVNDVVAVVQVAVVEVFGMTLSRCL